MPGPAPAPATTGDAGRHPWHARRARHARRSERLAVVATVAGAGAAWLALAVAAHGPGKAHLEHHNPATSAGATGQAAFALGWLAMVAGMMLPPSLRYVRALARLLDGRRHGRALLLAGLAGFALVWMLVGELFQLGDIGIHAAVDATPWLHAHPYLVTAASLAVAGAYQLTPLKARCLRACRLPAGFLARGWHGVSPTTELFGVGAAYGWSCVGCCWALMLVMFAAGLTSLWLMAALALIMMAERMAPRAEAAVVAVAVAFLAAAALVAVGVVPGFTPA